MDSTKFVIIGANGQLGRALQAKYPDARAVDAAELDITDRAAIEAFDWTGVTHIFNAAAYTNVDGAETPEGRRAAWAINADGVANLVAVAAQYDATLVHISTDYVLDGTIEVHAEDEGFAPLSTYGASKAAGDLAVSLTPKFYLLRTSWVIGEGKNFVRTMQSLADQGIKPSVVDDQVGRLTFTSTLVDGITHLIDTKAPFGTYNLTNDGDPASWAEVAKEVYDLAGKSRDDVTPVTTKTYYEGKQGIAPRPLQSTLNIIKIQRTGFSPPDWRDELRIYFQTSDSQGDN